MAQAARSGPEQSHQLQWVTLKCHSRVWSPVASRRADTSAELGRRRRRDKLPPTWRQQRAPARPPSGSSLSASRPQVSHRSRRALLAAVVVLAGPRPAGRLDGWSRRVAVDFIRRPIHRRRPLLLICMAAPRSAPLWLVAERPEDSGPQAWDGNGSRGSGDERLTKRFKSLSCRARGRASGRDKEKKGAGKRPDGD